MIVVVGWKSNGNITGDGTWTHSWDYKDRLLTSAKTGATVNYSYDEGGTRVTKTNATSGKTSIYVSDLLDIEGGTEKLAFFANDLKLATLENSATPTLAFHHPDHLSSGSVDTDTSGNLIALNDYFPYGETRLEEGTFENDYKFTGKEQDEDTGLLYYEARYYDSKLGRFISLDPWGGDIENPQSLNKYAYSLNNPLKYVDPDGKEAVTLTAGAVYVFGEALLTFMAAAFVYDDLERGNPFTLDSIDVGPETPAHTGQEQAPPVPDVNTLPQPAAPANEGDVYTTPALPANEGSVYTTPVAPPTTLDILGQPVYEAQEGGGVCGQNMSCAKKDPNVIKIQGTEVNRVREGGAEAFKKEWGTKVRRTL